MLFVGEGEGESVLFLEGADLFLKSILIRREVSYLPLRGYLTSTGARKTAD
jgi:hypothetical protein